MWRSAAGPCCSLLPSEISQLLPRGLNSRCADMRLDFRRSANMAERSQRSGDGIPEEMCEADNVADDDHPAGVPLRYECIAKNFHGPGLRALERTGRPAERGKQPL